MASTHQLEENEFRTTCLLKKPADSSKLCIINRFTMHSYDASNIIGGHAPISLVILHEMKNQAVDRGPNIFYVLSTDLIISLST